MAVHACMINDTGARMGELSEVTPSAPNHAAWIQKTPSDKNPGSSTNTMALPAELDMAPDWLLLIPTVLLKKVNSPKQMLSRYNGNHFVFLASSLKSIIGTRIRKKAGQTRRLFCYTRAGLPSSG